MKITNIEARWMRRLPREQYGHSEAELRASAVIGDGEDAVEAADALLTLVASVTGAKLGLRDEVKGVQVRGTQTTAAPKAEAAEIDTKSAVRAKGAGKKSGRGNIADNPEDRKNPEDDVIDDTVAEPAKESSKSDDVLADDAKPAAADGGEVMSTEDFQAFINKVASSGKVPVDKIKAIMAKHGASRIGEVKEGDRAVVKKKIEAEYKS